MRWRLGEISEKLGGASTVRDQYVGGISTDTRTLRAGDLFFALGEGRTNGHHYVGEALKRGAAAVVVSEPVECSSDQCIAVQDTLKALQTLANHYRKTFQIPVLGITGTNGKTTTKEMIASVLSKKYKIFRSPGNLNNHIGVPLSICSWEEDTEIAIVEMGTNHFGEIETLCKIAEPTHGVITNIGKGHLEFLENLEGVAKAKKELLEYLDDHGVAFLNADDPFLKTSIHRVPKTITYGLSNGAHVRGERLSHNQNGCGKFKVGEYEIQLSVPGHFQLYNALAAVAVGLHFHLTHEEIREALESFAPAMKRMEVLKINRLTLLNDAYNANPTSMKNALETVANMWLGYRKIAVLGDMLEIGSSSMHEHQQIGLLLGSLSFDACFCLGEATKHTVETAIHTGMDAFHFNNMDELADVLLGYIRDEDVILIKGSRGMQMERVIAHIQAEKGE